MKKYLLFGLMVLTLVVGLANVTYAAGNTFFTTLSATTPLSHEVNAGEKNVELAHFLVVNIHSKTVRVVNFNLKEEDLNTTQKGTLTNVRLYDVNGKQLGNASNSTSGIFAFSNYNGLLKVAPNTDFKVIVKADISTTVKNNSSVGVSFIKMAGVDEARPHFKEIEQVNLYKGQPLVANLMKIATCANKPNIELVNTSTYPTSAVQVDESTSGSSIKSGSYKLSFSVTAPTCSDIYVDTATTARALEYTPFPTTPGFSKTNKINGGTLITSVTVSGATSKGSYGQDKVSAGVTRYWTVSGYIPHGGTAGYVGMMMAGIRWNMKDLSYGSTDQTWDISNIKTPSVYVTQ